jgi:hypothetical protein
MQESFHFVAMEYYALILNRRLKKMYAEAQLSTDLLKEALAKKW